MEDSPSGPQNLTFVPEPLPLDLNTSNNNNHKIILEIGGSENSPFKPYKPELRPLNYHSYQYFPNEYEYIRPTYIPMHEASSFQITREVSCVPKGGSPKMSDQGN